MNKFGKILMISAMTLSLTGCSLIDKVKGFFDKDSTSDVSDSDSDSGSDTGSGSDTHLHTEDEGVVTTPATCTTAGVKTYTCTGCGEVVRTEEVAVDPTNHVNTSSVYTVATLDTPAYNLVTCADCEATYHANEDAWTARSAVQAFADIVFEDSSDAVRGATLEDGTEVRYTAANFGSALGTVPVAIGAVHDEIFTQLDGIEVVAAPYQGENGQCALYKYESDYTLVGIQVDAYTPDEISVIIQVMAYLVDVAE